MYSYNTYRNDTFHKFLTEYILYFIIKNSQLSNYLILQLAALSLTFTLNDMQVPRSSAHASYISGAIKGVTSCVFHDLRIQKNFLGLPK